MKHSPPTSERRCDAVATLQMLQNPGHTIPQSHPPFPRTSASRLSQPDALPIPLPAEPVPAASIPSRDANTVLYLAYGSNLAAKVFQGTRGIKPLSAVAVSAPSLRLSFDLAGIPYAEPCFANAAIREIPKLPVPIPDPPKTPPKIPDMPPVPNPPSLWPHGQPSVGSDGVERNAAGDPVWRKGMIGVVYEVTKEDYATIIRTEGGGSSYQDIFVPCIPLPPSVRVPEKPSVPDLPKMFVAHTLFAPRIPDEPRDPDAQDGDDGSDPDQPEVPHPNLPSWMRRLLLPVRRPDPDYAQASARYLDLIRDGAKENFLPADYQAYLNALQPYTITTTRQKVGRTVYALFCLPFIAFILLFSRLFSDKETGRVPPWLAAASNVVFNLSWMVYDYIIKPVFGEGERTEEEGEQGRRRLWLGSRRMGSAKSRWFRKDCIEDEEKRCLIRR